MGKLEELERRVALLEEGRMPKTEPTELEKLRLEVDEDGCLDIRYRERVAGHVSFDGECNIINTTVAYKVYCEWRDNGMHVDHTEVEWRGGTYWITSEFYLQRKDIDSGVIYNFKSLEYHYACKDENIIRNKYNYRPIGF